MLGLNDTTELLFNPVDIEALIPTGHPMEQMGHILMPRRSAG
jgi:hypothetical protein